MNVFLVSDVLLIHNVGMDPLLIVLPLQDVIEPLLKIFAVAGQVGPLAFTEEQQLTLMGL